MAVKNGSRFLHHQISSILPQLAGEDEVIVADDHSTDDSMAVIKSFGDQRIQIVSNERTGVVSNFETALRHCQGKYVFLADQDDVWAPEKVAVSIAYLKEVDMVVSDCYLIDGHSKIVAESFFKLHHSSGGLLKNFIRNSYMGCCMAFHRSILEKALPFPPDIPMHDLWLGLIAERYFQVKFIPEKLLYHRRHEKNTSSSSMKSNNSLLRKLKLRYDVLKNLR